MNKPTKKELKAQRKLERQHEEELQAQKTVKQQKLKQYGLWGIFAAVLLISAGSIFYLLTNKPPKATEVPQLSSLVNPSLPAVTEKDYQSGTTSAKLTLIEYGDFQCPACAHYFPMVSKVKTDYKDKVNVVFRNFPIPSVHKNAELAAQAAYAAGKQNKFWEMHDLLYKNQEKWSESDTADEQFTIYASELQLNPIQFTFDMSSDEAKTFVTEQALGGKNAGVAGTPTFYINGHFLTNPATYEEFKAIIDQELSK